MIDPRVEIVNAEAPTQAEPHKASRSARALATAKEHARGLLDALDAFEAEHAELERRLREQEARLRELASKVLDGLARSPTIAAAPPAAVPGPASHRTDRTDR